MTNLSFSGNVTNHRLTDGSEGLVVFNINALDAQGILVNRYLHKYKNKYEFKKSMKIDAFNKEIDKLEEKKEFMFEINVTEYKNESLLIAIYSTKYEYCLQIDSLQMKNVLYFPITNENYKNILSFVTKIKNLYDSIKD